MVPACRFQGFWQRFWCCPAQFVSLGSVVQLRTFGMTKFAKLMLLACASLVLVGCAAPGAPPTVGGAKNNLDALPYCQNVKGSARLPDFNTKFYLTTWGSAAREGAILGVREGLAEGGGVGLIALARLPKPSRVRGAPVIWRQAQPIPFCMRINAPESKVAPALRSSFKELSRYGYRSSRSGEIVSTGFVRREHRAAKWMDRFSGFTYPLPDGGTAVVVQRDILISRQDSPYVQGSSVGQLETWVLARTRQKSTGR